MFNMQCLCKQKEKKNKADNNHIENQTAGPIKGGTKPKNGTDGEPSSIEIAVPYI
jgi:hypothetical protein